MKLPEALLSVYLGIAISTFWDVAVNTTSCVNHSKLEFGKISCRMVVGMAAGIVWPFYLSLTLWERYSNEQR